MNQINNHNKNIRGIANNPITPRVIKMFKTNR